MSGHYGALRESGWARLSRFRAVFAAPQGGALPAPLSALTPAGKKIPLIENNSKSLKWHFIFFRRMRAKFNRKPWT